MDQKEAMLHKNRWIIPIVVIVAIVGLYVILPKESDTSTSTADNTKQTSQEVEQASSSSQQPVDIAKSFIDSFNELSDTKMQITDIYDPTDKNSDYYRTEFRLNAYKNSKGVRVVVGDMTADLIARSDNGLRIYVDGPEASVMSIYPDLIKTADPNISDSDINSFINKYNATDDGYKDFSQSISNLDSTKYITNDGIINHGDKGTIEALIDTLLYNQNDREG